MEGKPEAELKSAEKVIRDITDHEVSCKHARDRLSFVCRASEVLASSIEYSFICKQVARLAVPVIGDWCLLELLEADGKVQRVEVACADSRKETLASILKKYPPRLDPLHPTYKVLSSRMSQVLSPPPNLRKFAQSDEHFQVMCQVNAKQCLIVPLIVRNEVLGALTFIYSESGRNFRANDIDLAEDLARRASMAIDTARLYREAQSAIRLREDFLYIASHELKTPLTSVILQLQLLKQLYRKSEKSPSEQEKVGILLNMIERDLIQQSSLINHLLDVTRMQSGQLLLEKENMDLCGVVKDVLARFKNQLEQGRYKVSLQGPSFIIGFWDKLRLEQLVTNLLSNAIKYGQGNPIQIILTKYPDTAEIQIKDNGFGIPKEKQAYVFERFHRATSEKGKTSLGLGLYISKQIVDAHKGHISLVSEPGKGTLFRVVLPLMS